MSTFPRAQAWYYTNHFQSYYSKAPISLVQRFTTRLPGRFTLIQTGTLGQLTINQGGLNVVDQVHCDETSSHKRAKGAPERGGPLAETKHCFWRWEELECSFGRVFGRVLGVFTARGLFWGIVMTSTRSLARSHRSRSRRGTKERKQFHPSTCLQKNSIRTRSPTTPHHSTIMATTMMTRPRPKMFPLLPPPPL